MSAACTPPDLSAAVTRLVAAFACASADETEDELTCTPMDSTSWLGVPLTVPVPVTVIFPLPVGWVSEATPAAPPADGLACAVPSRNEPTSSAAAPTPIAGAR